MLAKIKAPAASAQDELPPRLCPPGTEAAGDLVRFWPAPDLIVDEDLPSRRPLFRRQLIAIH